MWGRSENERVIQISLDALPGSMQDSLRAVPQLNVFVAES